MKYNYIFNSIDTNKIIIPKIKVSSKSKKKRKERLYKKRIPKKYNIYIKSEFWKKRRNKYFKDFGRKCFICGSVKYIQIHHLEYDNNYYGIEKDEMLVNLCRECHEQFHSIYGTKRKMYDEFNEFIDLRQSEELLKFI